MLIENAISNSNIPHKYLFKSDIWFHFIESYGHCFLFSQQSWQLMTNVFDHCLMWFYRFLILSYFWTLMYIKSMKARLMDFLLGPLELKETSSCITYMLFYPHLYGKQTEWHCPPWPWSHWDQVGHLPPDKGQRQTGSWTNTPWL